MLNEYAQQAVMKVGQNGKFQKIFLVLQILISISFAYCLLGPSFILMNPIFKCSFAEGEVKEDVACPRIDQCSISNNFTLTAQAQLYCDNQLQRNFVQSSLYVGSIFGLFLMNIVSDTKGRKFSYLLSLSIAVLGAITTTTGGFLKNIFLMTLGQFIVGFGGYAGIIPAYIMISDFCSGKIRGMAIVSLNGFWAMGETSLALFYFYFPEWYNFQIFVVIAPLVLFIILGMIFFAESPVFYACKKKDYKAAMKQLAYIAKINGKEDHLEEASEYILLSIRKAQQDEQKVKQSPIKIIFREKTFLKTIILIALIQISTNMFYYGIQFELESLGQNFGISILLAGGIETIAFFSLNFIVAKAKRRKGLLITNIASFVFGMCFLLPFMENSSVLQSVLLVLCRLMNTYSQGFVPLLQTQSFPQQIQSTGAGMIEGLSQIGSFSTPYVVSLITNIGQKPVIFMSILVITIGIIPLKFIKQTFRSFNKEQKSLLLESEESTFKI